jgi:hypothetical protein
LCKQDIQHFLDEQENHRFINEIAVFSEDAEAAFANEWIRAGLADNKINILQIANISKGGSVALWYSEIQCFVEEEGNWQYFDIVLEESKVLGKFENSLGLNDVILSMIESIRAKINSPQLGEC